MTPELARANFERFHARNPHVYAALKAICRQVKLAGRDKYGMQAIFERLRWLSEFETEGDTFKLNNNYRSFYTRLLLTEAEFEGFIMTRYAPMADE